MDVRGPYLAGKERGGGNTNYAKGTRLPRGDERRGGGGGAREFVKKIFFLAEDTHTRARSRAHTNIALAYIFPLRRNAPSDAGAVRNN